MMLDYTILAPMSAVTGAISPFGLGALRFSSGMR